MPLWVVAYVVAGLANVGLPGLSGFTAEFHIFVGTFRTYPIFGGLAILAAAIAAAYMLRMFGVVFFGPLKPRWRDLKDMSPIEAMAASILIVSMLAMGLWWAPFTDRLAADDSEPARGDELMRDYTLFIPEYIAVGSAAAILTAELIWPRIRKDLLAYATALGAAAWLIAALFYIGHTPGDFQGLLRTDDFTTYFRILAAAIVFVVALLSAQYMSERTSTAGEYYGLLLIGGIGMVLMAASQELLTAYISLELLSFSLYILVGFLKKDILSNEASLKYILLGAFSSAMLLYGISILYGLTGSTTYDGIAQGLADRGNDTDAAAIVGIMLIIAGVGFKVSAAPFHMWAPDAYEGAPMPITAFLSTASKAAGFALILRLFTGALIVDAIEWRAAIAALAAITMTAGNLIAIQQTNLKRLVAYSSIGQVGYMLVVIAAIGYGDAATAEDASAALLLHLVGYTVSTLALFSALNRPLQPHRRRQHRGVAGLGRNAALPRTRDHGVALLVRGVAVLRGLRDEVPDVPGEHHGRAPLARGPGRREQLREPLLLLDGDAPDVPIRAARGPHALPPLAPARWARRNPAARPGLHRRLPPTHLRCRRRSGLGAVRGERHGARQGAVGPEVSLGRLLVCDTAPRARGSRTPMNIELLERHNPILVLLPQNS